MKKIYDFINSIKFPGLDKLKHFLIGDYIANLSFILITILITLFNFPIQSYYFLPLTASVVGGLKEYFDKKYNLGNPELLDFVYTIKTSIQYLIIIIIILLIRK